MNFDEIKASLRSGQLSSFENHSTKQKLRVQSIMSSVYESFNIMQVDEETKQVVSSYISNCQHKYLKGNKLLRIIPELVTHLCMRYYYRTNSIYEWKVTDNPQLTNIKNAVPGQSFNHHFKLHKLDWFLKVCMSHVTNISLYTVYLYLNVYDIFSFIQMVQNNPNKAMFFYYYIYDQPQKYPK